MEDIGLKVKLYIHITSEYEWNLCIVAMTLTNNVMIHQRNKAPLCLKNAITLVHMTKCILLNLSGPLLIYGNKYINK